MSVYLGGWDGSEHRIGGELGAEMGADAPLGVDEGGWTGLWTDVERVISTPEFLERGLLLVIAGEDEPSLSIEDKSGSSYLARG